MIKRIYSLKYYTAARDLETKIVGSRTRHAIIHSSGVNNVDFGKGCVAVGWNGFET